MYAGHAAAVCAELVVFVMRAGENERLRKEGYQDKAQQKGQRGNFLYPLPAFFANSRRFKHGFSPFPKKYI